MPLDHPQILFAIRHPDRPASLAEYRELDGYRAFAEALEIGSPPRITQTISESGLLGRGGAAFPAGLKLRTVADDAPFPRYVVCNADEMEPGTFKDRALLLANPHMVIEGIMLASYAVSANTGFIFIRPEYEDVAEILERELDILRREGWLGRDILGSGFDLDITVHRSGGRYICGEVTAQINALMGKRAHPSKPPPYPTEKGLWGLPTVLSNVESLACFPGIMRHGGQWFKDQALTESAAGTKLFSVSGRIRKPGVYELPLGVPLHEILEYSAGGMEFGSEFKACLPGGASTGFLTPEHYQIPMDFNSLKEVGNGLGTGSIMVFDQKTCLVAVTLNLIDFFARESCGWCTPCREGLPLIRDLLRRIEHGEGEDWFIPELKRQCRHLSRAFCAFAPGAAMPVASLLEHFEGEVHAHIVGKKCPFFP